MAILSILRRGQEDAESRTSSPSIEQQDLTIIPDVAQPQALRLTSPTSGLQVLRVPSPGTEQQTLAPTFATSWQQALRLPPPTSVPTAPYDISGAPAAQDFLNADSVTDDNAEQPLTQAWFEALPPLPTSPSAPNSENGESCSSGPPETLESPSLISLPYASSQTTAQAEPSSVPADAGGSDISPYAAPQPAPIHPSLHPYNFNQDAPYDRIYSRFYPSSSQALRPHSPVYYDDDDDDDNESYGIVEPPIGAQEYWGFDPSSGSGGAYEAPGNDPTGSNYGSAWYGNSYTASHNTPADTAGTHWESGYASTPSQGPMTGIPFVQAAVTDDFSQTVPSYLTSNVLQPYYPDSELEPPIPVPADFNQTASHFMLSDEFPLGQMKANIEIRLPPSEPIPAEYDGEIPKLPEAMADTGEHEDQIAPPSNPWLSFEETVVRVYQRLFGGCSRHWPTAYGVAGAMPDLAYTNQATEPMVDSVMIGAPNSAETAGVAELLVTEAEDANYDNTGSREIEMENVDSGDLSEYEVDVSTLQFRENHERSMGFDDYDEWNGMSRFSSLYTRLFAPTYAPSELEYYLASVLDTPYSSYPQVSIPAGSHLNTLWQLWNVSSDLSYPIPPTLNPSAPEFQVSIMAPNFEVFEEPRAEAVPLPASVSEIPLQTAGDDARPSPLSSQSGTHTRRRAPRRHGVYYHPYQLGRKPSCM